MPCSCFFEVKAFTCDGPLSIENSNIMHDVSLKTCTDSRTKFAKIWFAARC